MTLDRMKLAITRLTQLATQTDALPEFTEDLAIVLAIAARSPQYAEPSTQH